MEKVSGSVNVRISQITRKPIKVVVSTYATYANFSALNLLKISTKLLNPQKQPPGVFCKKGVLRNFAKFTGKHLCQRLFFNKVAGLRPEIF